MKTSCRLKTIFADNWFLILGIIIQIVVFAVTNSSLLAFISALSGVFAVVWTSEKRFACYIPSFIQLITYLILAYQAHFYGEVMEYIFYFIAMIIGIFLWRKDVSDGKVTAKQMNGFAILSIVVIMTLTIIAFGRHLSSTNDSQPYMDALTTVPAFFAQILMMLKYREQWIFWLIIDIFSTVMWAIEGDWCMTAQFAYWTANCLYGYKMWSKQ